jgi:uncharacterized protein YwgA
MNNSSRKYHSVAQFAQKLTSGLKEENEALQQQVNELLSAANDQDKAWEEIKSLGGQVSTLSEENEVLKLQIQAKDEEIALLKSQAKAAPAPVDTKDTKDAKAKTDPNTNTPTKEEAKKKK